MSPNAYIKLFLILIVASLALKWWALERPLSLSNSSEQRMGHRISAHTGQDDNNKFVIALKHRLLNLHSITYSTSHERVLYDEDDETTTHCHRMEYWDNSNHSLSPFQMWVSKAPRVAPRRRTVNESVLDCRPCVGGAPYHSLQAGTRREFPLSRIVIRECSTTPFTNCRIMNESETENENFGNNGDGE
eukprot:PhF_6_TR41841/c0_g1_i1/m.63444